MDAEIGIKEGHGNRYLMAFASAFLRLGCWAEGKVEATVGGRGLVPLRNIKEVVYGIKTGANDFFYLDEETAKNWGIEKKYLKPW